MATWMIVEDDADIVTVMSRLFWAWQIETVSFLDVPDAIDWIDLVDGGYDTGELPALAILDLRFYGEILGHEVGKRLRSSPYLKDIPIVFMTAVPDPAIREMIAAACKPELYLAKGKYTWDQLRGIFFEVIERNQAAVAKRKAANKRRRRPKPPADNS